MRACLEMVMVAVNSRQQQIHLAADENCLSFIKSHGLKHSSQPACSPSFFTPAYAYLLGDGDREYMLMKTI